MFAIYLCAFQLPEFVVLLFAFVLPGISLVFPVSDDFHSSPTWLRQARFLVLLQLQIKNGFIIIIVLIIINLKVHMAKYTSSC